MQIDKMAPCKQIQQLLARAWALAQVSTVGHWVTAQFATFAVCFPIPTIPPDHNDSIRAQQTRRFSGLTVSAARGGLQHSSVGPQQRLR